MALPGLGFIRTFALGSIVSVAAYIVVVSPSLVRGLRYGALTLVLGVGLYALAPKVVVLFASATLGAGDERLSALGGLDGSELRPRCLAGMAVDAFYRQLDKAPPMDRVSVEMGRRFWYLDASKAERELDFHARDPYETLHETVAYIKTELLGASVLS